MSISGAARLAGVIGWPVAQSLSPRLHGHWLREHGIDGAYVPLAVRPEDFSLAVTGLKLAGFHGVNVTVPHKEAAYALADLRDAAADAIGAANLLVFGEHGIEGRNTDAAGLAASLEEELGRDRIKGRVASVWGAGGTARAAVYALWKMGAAEIHVFNRTHARAESLVAMLAPSTTAKLAAHGFEAWAATAARIGVLVQTTSAGMKDTPSIDLSLETLPQDCVVTDVVYHPLRTDLLARAAVRGLRTVDGLGMLMHQAAPAFAAFFGVEPRVTAGLRRSLEEALRG
jgi:shikimate dehydrogenase